MAMVAYQGTTEPQDVVNNNAFYGDSGSGSTTTPPASGSFDSLLPGDRFVVFLTINSATAVVNSIILKDNLGGTVPGITFSKAGSVRVGSVGMEIWTSTALAAQGANGPWVLFVTNSAAVASNFYVKQLRSCSGFSAVSSGGNAVAGTTWSLNSPAVAVPNGMALTVISSPSIPAVTRSTPGNMQAGAYVLSGTTIRSQANWAPIEGTGVTPSESGTIGSSTTWIGMSIIAYGAVVTMDELTYMVREDGVLLNGPVSSPPFYDIDTVVGLDDSSVTVASSAIDGADGSYVDAKFLTGKSIAITGTLYTPVPTDEAVVDALKYCTRPTQLDGGVPFFYKLPGYNPRYIMVKPTGFNSDISRMRTLGQIPFQITLASADPRSYSGEQSVGTNTLVASAYKVAAAISGNIESYPKLYFQIYSTEQGVGRSLTFTSDVWGSQHSRAGIVTISAVDGTTLPSGSYCLDLGARTLTKLGTVLTNVVTVDVDYSSAITTRQWFGLVPGLTNTITMTRPGGIVTNEGFMMSTKDAWR